MSRKEWPRGRVPSCLRLQDENSPRARKEPRRVHKPVTRLAKDKFGVGSNLEGVLDMKSDEKGANKESAATSSMSSISSIDSESPLGKALEKMRELTKNNPLSAHHWFEQFMEVAWHQTTETNREISASEKDFMHSFIFESDRGCVLVTSCIIDKKLEMILRKRFSFQTTMSAPEMEFFFGGNQPLLQSTSVKVRLSYALSLIDDHLKNSLIKLQSLRSKIAAHSRRPMKLTKEHVNSIVKPLREDSKKMFRESISDMAPVFQAGRVIKSVSDEKCLFIGVAMTIFNLLEVASNLVNLQTGMSEK
jgi:hypothetical protein